MLRNKLHLAGYRMFEADTGATSGTDSTTGDATGTNGGSESKTFTQADVDRLISNRLASERKRIEKDITTDLRKQWEDEQARKQKEEQQEYKPLYEAALAEKQAAQEELQTAVAAHRSALARLQIESIATQERLVAPALAYRLIDMEQIVWDDDGNPTNIKDLVQALIKEQPDLVKTAGNKAGIDAVGGGGSSTVLTREQRVNGYLEQAGLKRN